VLVDHADDRHLADGRRLGERRQLREPRADVRAQVDGGEAERDVVVQAAEQDPVHGVAVEPQPAGRLDVDLPAQRADHLELRVERQRQQVVDRAELAQVLSVPGCGERAPAGHPLDHALGHQVVEGAPHRLPADLVFLRQLGLRGQSSAVGVPAAQDAVTQRAGEPHVRRLRPSSHAADSRVRVL
jgi:hypothetical protein